jgi:hypothetical protein
VAHTYDDILDERVLLANSDDLPALDARLAARQASLSDAATRT